MEPVKIQIEKEDKLPVIASKVFSSDADQVVLMVPKFSKLAESVDNFKFLKSGLNDSKRKLIIESVDDEVIKLASQAGIEAKNPFFVRQSEELDSLDLDGEEIEDDKISEATTEEEPRNKKKDIFDKIDKELEHIYDTPIRLTTRSTKGRFLGAVLLASFLIIGWWSVTSILPRAEIDIVTKKSDWEFNGEILVDKNAVTDDLQNLKIPGQIFSQVRNGQMTFPASSKKTVSQKAKGTIVIYNGYSSDPQPLVATTRFQTSDGKIVRIDERVTVPGAKIVDGKITPSSVVVAVTADQPGQEYNIGPIAKLTVPGLKGSPKYSGFYGDIETPLVGGYVGERAYPTDEDIELGKEKIIATFKDSLKMSLSAKVPQDFKIPEGVEEFTVLKMDVDKNANDKGEFSIFAEAEYSIMGFREQDILTTIANKIKIELGDNFNIKSHELNYEIISADLENDKLALAVNFKAVVEEGVDISNLRQRVAGQSEADLKALIFGLSGLENAQVSLWPFWVGNVPIKADKIKISVD